MKLFLLPIAILFLLCSCSQESRDKSKIYDIAIENIKSQLKAPSSAKFQDKSDAKFIIKYKSEKMKMSEWLKLSSTSFEMTGNPEIDKQKEDLLKSIDKKNGHVTLDHASLSIKVSAQNAFGVYLNNEWFVLLRKAHYSDGTEGDWEVSISSEL